MASARQITRMAAVRSALELLRPQQFTTGYGLVVLGGAYTPSTKIDTSVFNNIDCKSFDSYDFASSHSSLSPIAFLGRHLVVSGGVLATTNTHLDHSIDALALCGTFLVRTHRIFRPQPSRPPFTDPICSVVPSRFWLWPRSGIG